MYVILSQKVDTDSIYSDDLFNTYHYPARYKNQLHTGDIFIYYQGNRYKSEHRYYFGVGTVGEILTTDGESYYARLLRCRRFENQVPIYVPDGGYVEQRGYESVRRSLNPPWQTSIRPLSKDAYDYIIEKAGILISTNPDQEIDVMKNALKRSLKEFYLGGNQKAILSVVSIAQQIADTLQLGAVAVCEDTVTAFSAAQTPDPTQQKTKTMFFDYCRSMRMSYSYKPVLILAVLDCGVEKGQVSIERAACYFRDYYTERRKNGLKIEKGNCIYQRGDVDMQPIAGNIVANPVKALIASGYFEHDRTAGLFGFAPRLWAELSRDDLSHIRGVCVAKLENYYSSK